jgi:pseudaminic acid cytidylyltransferase
MRVAIIPARGGSKRIPKKNIKEFCGKPMIAWSIEAAKSSDCFDRIIVSTDSQEIANVAKNFGAEVPFVRPANLSDDHTTVGPVINHAIKFLSQNGCELDEVCCIYATAPFIQPSEIRTGLYKLQNLDCDFSFSVCSYQFPIQRAFSVLGEVGVSMYKPNEFNTRSQDLEEAYHDAGQFYWGYPNSWGNNIKMFSERSAPVILPHYRVQDIDTIEDWIRAELLFEAINNSNIK